MVYTDLDNPNYHGVIATSAADGMIIGRSSAYFATSLIHEIGHAVDSTLASPDAVHPGYGTSFSSTPAWHAAADADGYAVSAYGAGSYSEDFPDTGRAVLLDAIYPGGLAAWTGNNPNLTQIAHQLAAFKAVAGSYYTVGGTCDPALKFPFPTLFVDVAVPATTTTTSAASGPTAGPYGQCEYPLSVLSLSVFLGTLPTEKKNQLWVGYEWTNNVAHQAEAGRLIRVRLHVAPGTRAQLSSKSSVWVGSSLENRNADQGYVLLVLTTPSVPRLKSQVPCSSLGAVIRTGQMIPSSPSHINPEPEPVVHGSPQLGMG